MTVFWILLCQAVCSYVGGAFYMSVCRNSVSLNLFLSVGSVELQKCSYVLVLFQSIFKVVYLTLIYYTEGWINNVGINNAQLIIAKNPGFRVLVWTHFDPPLSPCLDLVSPIRSFPRPPVTTEAAGEESRCSIQANSNKMKVRCTWGKKLC